MSRSPRAPLSPNELSALRRVANGLAHFLDSSHRDVLISMGLASLTLKGNIALTEAGRQRLAAEDLS